MRARDTRDEVPLRQDAHEHAEGARVLVREGRQCPCRCRPDTASEEDQQRRQRTGGEPSCGRRFLSSAASSRSGALPGPVRGGRGREAVSHGRAASSDESGGSPHDDAATVPPFAPERDRGRERLAALRFVTGDGCPSARGCGRQADMGHSSVLE